MTTIRRVERLLRQAIERRLEEGYGLQVEAFNLDDEHEHWLTDAGTTCAVGMFLIGHCRISRVPQLDAAAYLEVGCDAVSDIIRAFYDPDDPDIVEDSPYVDLGRRLRRDYYEVEG